MVCKTSAIDPEKGPARWPAKGRLPSHGRAEFGGYDHLIVAEDVPTAHLQANSAGRLTRAGVAKLLGVSIGTVRNLEKEGALRTTKDGSVNLFDPKEVAKLKATRDRAGARRAAPLSEGEIAAACFERFRQGVGVVDIVIELKIPPAKVRELLRQFFAGDVDPDAGRSRAGGEPRRSGSRRT
jgi:hypothetical protein